MKLLLKRVIESGSYNFYYELQITFSREMELVSNFSKVANTLWGKVATHCYDNPHSCHCYDLWEMV